MISGLDSRLRAALELVGLLGISHRCCFLKLPTVPAEWYPVNALQEIPLRALETLDKQPVDGGDVPFRVVLHARAVKDVFNASRNCLQGQWLNELLFRHQGFRNHLAKDCALTRLDEFQERFPDQLVERSLQQCHRRVICVVDYKMTVGDYIGGRGTLEQFLEVAQRSTLMIHFVANPIVRPTNAVRPGAGSKNFPRAAFTLSDGEYARLKRFCTPATSDAAGSPNSRRAPARKWTT